MRQQSKQYRKLAHGIWKDRGNWTPTYVLNQQHAEGSEYQHFMLDANGKLVCAGVTRHTHMNQAQANQIFRVWRRWRNEYDTLFGGQPNPKWVTGAPICLIVHPIGDHTQQESYAL